MLLASIPGALKSNEIHIIPNGYEGTIETISGGARRSMHDSLHRNGRSLPLRHVSRGVISSSRAPFRLKRDVLQGGVRWRGSRAELSRRPRHVALTEIVETMGPVPSREVDRLQREAHALLLLGVKPYQGYELCGSKVFGYLKAGRPILGILPADESRKVLERVGVSTIANIDSPEEIVGSSQARPRDPGRPTVCHHSCPIRIDARFTRRQTRPRALVRALEGRPPLSPVYSWFGGNAGQPEGEDRVRRDGSAQPSRSDRLRFCIRDDDTNFFTQPEELERAYGRITQLGPVSLAVVPFCRAGTNKAVPEKLRGSVFYSSAA